MKEAFMIGAFEISPGGGEAYNVSYGDKVLARGVYAPGDTRKAVTGQLQDCIARLTDELRSRQECDVIYLMSADGDQLAGFPCDSIIDGMTPGLINDSHEYWLVTSNSLYSVPVTLQGYPAIVAKNASPPRSWIADLLPDAVLAGDPAEWLPPSAWHIRHVVGEGSFTGISGAAAAALVGVSPQNFRKYTAAEGAKNRQAISFAAWHLLLQRLQVTRPLSV